VHGGHVHVTELRHFGTPDIAFTCNAPPATSCSASTANGAPCSKIGSCTCQNDASQSRCWPSNQQQNFIDYAAVTTASGWDSFTYRIQSNDGNATASVAVRMTRCFCAAHPTGADVMFLLDGTLSATDWGWQRAFVDGVQRRSSGNWVSFGAYDMTQNIWLRPFRLGSCRPSFSSKGAPRGRR
jgi:hypothetical protein